VSFLLGGALLLLLSGCEPPTRAPGASLDSSPDAPTLDVGVASSMLPLFGELAKEFEKKHERTTINVHASGSRALVRRTTELDAAAFDILVLADRELFASLPKHAWREAPHAFARDRIVLAHAPRSEALSRETWFTELLAPEVRLGLADPNQAPLGYRSLFVLQLEEMRQGNPGSAKKIRNKVGTRFTWPHATALGAHLQTSDVDHALLYSSTANQLGLKFTELSDEVNLGFQQHEANYRRASAPVSGSHAKKVRWVRGASILYGIALREKEQQSASEFLRLLRGPVGERLLRAHGFAPVRLR